MNSIDSGVKFPDIINYDINNPGSMALYLAHCDFYPFRSVIENNKIALEAISDSYIDIAREANKINDFKRECWAMTSLGLHAYRVDLLTQYSLLVTMISLLEEAVNTLCRIYYDVYKIDKKLEDIEPEKGLERAAKYIKQEVNIKGFKCGKWEYIRAIRDARNLIVHNGGRVVKDKDFKKFDKFSIRYRDDNNQIYLEYTDIIKMYDAIMEFMDKSFRLNRNI